VILFSPSFGAPLHRVSASGGEPSPVTALDPSRHENAHLFPQFLPDGRHFLFLARSFQTQNSGIYLGSLDSKQTQHLLSVESNLAYVPPGYLLYVRDGTLMAQPFDARDLQLTGEAFAVAQQVVRHLDYSSFSVSDNGVLVYRSGMDKTQLAWLDREGKQVGLIDPPDYYCNPWLSPDEKRVAVQRIDPRTRVGDIWLLDLLRGTSSRFTFDPAYDTDPVWSPDGSRIVFASGQLPSRNLYQKSASGSGGEKVLLPSKEDKIPTDWSSDGRFIAYTVLGPKPAADVWVLPMFGECKPIPYLRREFLELQARFSPDGRWVAYTSNETGRSEVYVQGFPTPSGKWQVSTEGGEDPRWRRDGKELFYLAAYERLMVVEVKTAPTFQRGIPRALLQTQFAELFGDLSHYVVSKDGQRFLVNTKVGESSSSLITVVLNWTAELRR
jgi:eukaryotic-like serine/threonine-protein kinase